MHATAAGIILGTAAYMSPEQARGRPVDKRADIWAFGAVLYEMLTGRRAFDADDTSDTLAFVLTKEPDWTALPSATPALIHRLVRRCLEKDPKRRVPDIGVARLEIDEALATPAGSSAFAAATHSEAQPAARRWLVPFVAGVALAAVAAAVVAWVASRPAPTSSAVTRFGITLPLDQPLAISFNDRDLAVSPDGRHLVYTAGAQAQLMVRAFDRLDPQPLIGITNARAPFVSPDGRWVGFFDWLDEGITSGPVVSGVLRKVPIAGGPPLVIATITGASRGAVWGPDDSIVFATSDRTTGLLRVAASGGEPEVLTRPATNQGEQDHHFPSPLPGGRGLLFTIVGQGRRGVAVLDLRTGQWRTLIPSGTQAAYVDTGHLVYLEGGAFWAVPFDVAALDIAGDPVPVIESVTRFIPANEATANLAISNHGTLVYAPVEGGGTRSLVWVDRRGAEEPITAGQQPFMHPRLSPDGARVAVVTSGPRGFEYWTWDFAVQRLTPLQFGPSGSFTVWSRDSRYLIFNPINSPINSSSGRTRLSRRAVDGTGTAEPLTDGDRTQRPVDISPDGRRIVFEQYTPTNSYDLMVLALDAPSTDPGRTSPLLDTAADERNASIAPDGRWIAYESNKSGRSEIYVRPFPNVGDAEHPITTEGGRTPVWSLAGGELFFVSGSGLMAVAVQTTPSLRVGNPTRLFEAQSRILDGRRLGNTGRTFDVSRDGQRFLMLKGAAAADSALPSIVVVQNWFEELLAKMPVR
jgi:serine/threonine-protein kinase